MHVSMEAFQQAVLPKFCIFQILLFTIATDYLQGRDHFVVLKKRIHIEGAGSKLPIPPCLSFIKMKSALTLGHY